MLLRCVSLFALALSLRAAPISSLYFFGDSLTDTGNVYSATSLLSAVTLGIVPVTPASPPYYNGRFSNGPVWAEMVADKLGRPGDAAPAGMSLGVFGSLDGTGHNYAIGGARTGTGGALGAFDALVPTGMLAQVSYFISGTAAVDPNAIYFLLGAGNDMRDAAALTDPNAQISSMSNAALNMAVSIHSLYAVGARHFFLLNGPNIGLIPESLENGKLVSGFYASAFYNLYLNAFTATLQQQLTGIQIDSFDLFSLYNDLVTDTISGGSQYGFTSMAPCIDNQSACSSSLFFDSIHPTTKVHQLLADRVADQILGELNGTDPVLLSAAISAAAVPEPAAAGLIGIAISAGVLVRKRSRAA